MVDISMRYLNSFALASRKYRPATVRILFIAEAPPAYESKRFFYFTGLQQGDTLFLEMMKTLYPIEWDFPEIDSKTDFHPQRFDFEKARCR